LQFEKQQDNNLDTDPYYTPKQSILPNSTAESQLSLLGAS